MALMRGVWIALPFALVLDAAIAFGIYSAIPQTHHSPPRCTSAISEIRVIGNVTTHPNVVWYPEGCAHEPQP